MASGSIFGVSMDGSRGPIIGIDGTNWDLLVPSREDGALPNLAKLSQVGKAWARPEA
jgi:hypothetical protein